MRCKAYSAAVLVVATVAAVLADPTDGNSPVTAKSGPRSPLFLHAKELRRRSVRKAVVEHIDAVVKEVAVFPEGLEELLQLIASKGSGPKPAPRCGTCAVVGAAGTLARGSAGAEIDSHDCVFRLNLARTEYFERQVGKKFTVHVWALPTFPGNLGELGLLRKQTKYLLQHAMEAKNLTVVALDNGLVVQRVLALAKAGELPLARTRILHPGLLDELCNSIGMVCDRYKRPSTGLLAAHLAKRLCDSAPKLFGFDANSIPFHYYDPPDDTVCDAEVGARLQGQGIAHDWSFEQQVLHRWHQEGHMRLQLTDFAPLPSTDHCDVPRALEVESAFVELAGFYQVQPYVLNGKPVYERKSDEGDYASIKLLIFSLCASEGRRKGVWLIVPHADVVESQKLTPGSASICRASAVSEDFRPERPEASSWRISLDGGFMPMTEADFRMRAVRDPQKS